MPVSISNLRATFANSASAYSALSVDVTNLASAYGSKLLDLKVGGVTKFSIDMNGYPSSNIAIVDTTARSLAQDAQTSSGAGFDKANSANIIATAAFNKANSANFYAYLVDQNTKAAFDKANSAAISFDLKPAFDRANTPNIFIANTGTFGYTIRSPNRKTINFIEGSGVKIGIVDDPLADRSNVTITSTSALTGISSLPILDPNNSSIVWGALDAYDVGTGNTVELIVQYPSKLKLSANDTTQIRLYSDDAYWGAQRGKIDFYATELLLNGVPFTGNGGSGIGNSKSNNVIFNDNGSANGSNSLLFFKGNNTLAAANLAVLGTTTFITANSVNVINLYVSGAITYSVANNIIINKTEVNSVSLIANTGGLASTISNIDNFALADFRSAHYMVTMNAGSNWYTTQYSLVHDGSSVSGLQYGNVIMGTSVGNLTSSIVGSSVNLNLVSTIACTTVRIYRTATKT